MDRYIENKGEHNKSGKKMEILEVKSSCQVMQG